MGVATTIKGNIKKNSTKLEARRKDVAEKKRRLVDLTKTYNDGTKPEDKAEYDTLQAEVAQLDGELMEWETELEQLKEEETDGDPNVPTVVGGGTDDDDDATFTPAQAREAKGETYGGKIVAWRQQDKSKPVIVMYGPPNAAKYERSTAAKEDDDFDENETMEFGPDHRLGDQKVRKKFLRKKRELVGISGLAYNCDLADLAPREKGTSGRIAPLEILVKWDIAGVIQKKWEIRSSIRHLFSSAQKCDIYIYECAQWHAKRHQEWQDGQRKEKGVSPSPMPPGLFGRVNNGNQVNDQSSKEAQKAAMLQYREQWCTLKSIDPEKMDPAADAMFLKAWNEIKDTV